MGALRSAWKANSLITLGKNSQRWMVSGVRQNPRLTLSGLVIGLAVGLLFAWVIHPAAYANTTPGSLANNYKNAYRSLIAAAYATDGNLERARTRLALLYETNLVTSLAAKAQWLLESARSRLSQWANPDPVQSLAVQAQTVATQGGSPDDARRLADLASALNHTPLPPAAEPSQTPASSPTPLLVMQTPTAVSKPELSAPPGIIPTPTDWLDAWECVSVDADNRAQANRDATLSARQSTVLIAPGVRINTPTLVGSLAVLRGRQPVCDPTLTEGLLQVRVTDAAGNPLAGVRIQVAWSGGEDFFFTGLKPELGLGYADFEMAPKVVYAVRLAGGSQAAFNLTAPDCGHSVGADYWGGWMLSFTQ